MKFETLDALVAAYKSGELDGKESPVVIDNDSTTVYDDDGCIFNGGVPVELLESALNLLGVPCEPA